MKTPSTIQLSRFKRPKTVNYLEGFWAGYFRDIIKKVITVCTNRSLLKGRFSYKVGWRDIIKKVRTVLAAEDRPQIKALSIDGLSLKRAVSYKPNWRDVIIAFLLGLLILRGAPTHIIKDQIGGFAPAPAIVSIKPLPLLKDVSYKPVGGLETVYVNKLRPVGTYANDYTPLNCTEYVASRLPIPNSLGNASNWAYAMSLAGYTVSSQPKVGSIAQTSGDSSMGHVAIVESLNPDGSFVVSEMNYNGLGVIDTRTTSTAEFPNFIYV